MSVDGSAQVSQPKTASSRRRLPLALGLRVVLERARARHLVDAQRAGTAYDSSGLVVVDALGRGLHPDTLSSQWEKVTTAAGVSRIRLHDARHTCGTLLNLQGVPTAVISAWLGHSDAAFTMRVYVHSQPEVLNDVARHFERSL